MSDMTQAALAQVREALAAGPTPGPWHHCQPFQSVRAERTIHGPVPAQRVDFVSTKTQPVHERIIIPMAGREAHVRSEDMAFIAACSPANMTAIIAHVEAQAAENERLREAGIGYSQQTVDALTAERDKLRAAVEALREVVQWTRGMFQEAADRGDDDAGPVIEEHDAALRLADEAMGNDVERAA